MTIDTSQLGTSGTMLRLMMALTLSCLFTGCAVSRTVEVPMGRCDVSVISEAPQGQTTIVKTWVIADETLEISAESRADYMRRMQEERDKCK